MNSLLSIQLAVISNCQYLFWCLNFQICSVGAPQASFYVLFWHITTFLTLCLLSGTKRCSNLIGNFFCPSHGDEPFLQGAKFHLVVFRKQLLYAWLLGCHCSHAFSFVFISLLFTFIRLSAYLSIPWFCQLWHLLPFTPNAEFLLIVLSSDSWCLTTAALPSAWLSFQPAGTFASRSGLYLLYPG